MSNSAKETSQQGEAGRMSFREQLIRKNMSDCKHFTGIQHDCCAAGVNYEQLIENGKYKIPCIKATVGIGRDPAICEKFQAMTRNEAEKSAKGARRIEVGQMKVYVLAQNLREAKELRDAGCGYATKKQASDAKIQALKDGADSYYINLLAVYELQAESLLSNSGAPQKETK